MIEVELKFTFPAEAQWQLQDKLDALPTIRFLGHVENTDTYYDTRNFDCLRQAVFMRIRNHAQLEMKFHDDPDPAHMYCTERSFPLRADQPLMREINAFCARFIPAWCEAETIEEAMRLNALMELARIVNQRTQYRYQHLTLCIDNVEGLGHFFEVETLCEEGREMRQAQAQLQDFVAKLGLPSLLPVQTGYVEQWLDRYLPQICEKM